MATGITGIFIDGHGFDHSLVGDLLVNGRNCPLYRIHKSAGHHWDDMTFVVG